MRKDKAEIIRLRKSGKSYNEIRELIAISKSTLSGWLSDIGWSTKIKKELSEKAKSKGTIQLRELNRIRGDNLSRVYEEARSEAVEEFKEFKYHPLFISGVVIYWGEGDKKSKNLLRIANTDPLMIRLFVEFLQKVCAAPESRIKAWLLLYPDLNADLCKRFWIKNTGLAKNNFNKSILIEGRHKSKRIRYGVCNVGIPSTYLKEKMLVWLELLPKELLKREYYNL